MKTKMAQFLTNSSRQQQRGQEDWFTPYTICYTTRIPYNVYGNNFL